MPTQLVRAHIHEPQGGVDMDTKRIEHGKSVVIIHSPSGVISMTALQQLAWFEQEWKRCNPTVRALADTMINLANKWGDGNR